MGEATDTVVEWISFANTFLASFIIVLWYFAIWQEDKEDIDETKVTIIEEELSEKHMKSEKSTMVVTNSEENMMQRPKMDEREENPINMNISENQPKIFSWPENQKTLESLTKSVDLTFNQHVIDRLTELGIRRTERLESMESNRKTESEENMMEISTTDDKGHNLKTTDISKPFQETVKSHENPRALEILMEGKNATLDENIMARITELGIKKKDDIKTTETCKKTKNEKKAKKVQRKPLRSFKWPQDAHLMEKLRTNKTETTLKPELEHRLEDFGLVRKSSEPEANADKSLSVRARQTGKMLGRNKVRVCWDGFMAKSRPGLESETDSPKPKKSKTKQKNWRASKSKKLPETATEIVCAA